MCGIAGIMLRDGAVVDPKVLDTLAKALRHRGPDGEARHIAGNVGLIQTRLAIIDLQTGDQPFYEPSGAALVANGEIYNYVELRGEMTETPFRTASDCEVPLWVYADQGIDYANALRGMYAIAIHDPARSRLVLSRDPFGIKPLYYVETPEYFAFAQEPQALIAAGLLTPAVDANRRDEFLQLQFPCGQQSLMPGLNRVLPGETIVVSGGRIIERKLRAALPKGAPKKITEKEAIDQLDHAMRDSVMVHQRSDVPFGLFLSGGIDSTAILALMAELNTNPVVAFTAGFSGGHVHDERDHAAFLAKRVRADHHRIDFSEEDFWSLLPSVVASLDDPAADYAVLPTWKLAKEAAQNLKVVLSGEGGDEVFAGYGRYRSLLRPWFLGGRTIRHRGIFQGLGILKRDDTSWRDGIAASEALSQSEGRTRLQGAQAVDAMDWLSNDLLTKLDRCLMAHGLEGRTPFLDPVVVDTVFRLPDNLKIRSGHGKWILRKWLDGILPEADAFSKKRGFSVPVAAWIQGSADKLAPMVARQEALQEICHTDRISGVFSDGSKRAGFAAWVLLFYALWHKHHVEGFSIRDATIYEALNA